MRGLLAAALLLLNAGLASAQDYGWFKKPAPAPTVNLTAIVLVSDPESVLKSGLIDLHGIIIKGVPLIDTPEFRKMLTAQLGRPLTKSSLADITAKIVEYCRKQGRPFVDVSAPPQDVTSGIMQLLVVEGKVGTVRVMGNKWFGADQLAGKMTAKEGQPLDAKAIAADLDWLNRNPFRQVDLVYVKGSDFGQANLLLRETDRFPLRVYAGYDDSGNKLTEDERLSTGLNWGNVFWGDGQMDYQFITSPDFKSFRAHSLSFTQPLPWRHILTVFGSYNDIRAVLPPPLNLSGFNWQTSARYEVPLPGTMDYHHSLTAGFDYKVANNNLTFGGASVFNTATDVAQWSLGYSSRLKDPFGDTSLRLTGFYSPGGWGTTNNDAAFGAARSDARAHYHYGKLELNRTTGLPYGFLLVDLVTVQMADANLMASEQIGFGGFDTIRGYDTRVLNTDNGYIVSTEIRTPTIAALSRVQDWQILDDKFQFLGFVDYGAGSNHLRLSGERAESKLLSVGPGLRYTMSTNLSFRFDYGWQLLNQAEANRPYASRFHAGLVARY